VVDLADIGNTRRSRVSHTVVGAGRLTAQKDPRFFVNVVDGLRDIGEPIELRWLGGSIGRDADHLEEAGIAVTGWLPRQEAIRELASAAVYVHTAAWEGAPMALLEANALRVPIIARDIPALEGLPASVMAPTPSGMRSLIWKILTDPDAVKANLAVWDQYFSSNSVSTQVEALRLAYGESGAGNLEDQGL
jgi:glycosyltransferase involved in cell wall biosynthesis